MKRTHISLLLGLMLCCTLALNAQSKGAGGRFAMVNVDSLRIKLGLNAQQETSIKAIVSNYRPKIKDARDKNTDQTARREAMAPLVQAMQDEIRAVLTQEQQLKLDAMKAQRPRRGKP